MLLSTLLTNWLPLMGLLTVLWVWLLLPKPAGLIPVAFAASCLQSVLSSPGQCPRTFLCKNIFDTFFLPCVRWRPTYLGMATVSGLWCVEL